MLKRITVFTFALGISILLVGCGRNVLDAADIPTGPEYASYTSPDGLIENFAEAWRHRDIVEYRDCVLYDGAALASDGLAYEPFMFYFIRPDAEYGSAWDYEAECEHSEALFSGNPARGGAVPGVDHIELSLLPMGDWEAPGNPLGIGGDAYPEGTLSCDFATDMEITLKGSVAGGIDALYVRDRVRFYAIPVDAGGAVEYRLWKWMDLDNGQ